MMEILPQNKELVEGPVAKILLGVNKESLLFLVIMTRESFRERGLLALCVDGFN